MTNMTHFENISTLQGFLEGTNTVTGGGFGTGLMMAVFVISFYRLSGIGYVQAYVASSFTTGILAFIMASIKLIPAEIPFLVTAASLGGLLYMYEQGRI